MISFPTAGHGRTRWLANRASRRPARRAIAAGTLATVLSCVAPGAAGAQPHAAPAPIAGIDAQVERLMRDWEVPGLALAVVKGDSVVYARGYGVREAGRSAPVDERTLFAIGSVTKSFTAAAVATLVDEQRIGWDDKLADRLPGFALADAYLTRETTLRDALSHRVGVRGASVSLMNDFPRPEIVRRLRHLALAAPFRTRMAYQNQMYVAVGEAAARAAGTSWDALVRDRLLVPLAMVDSRTSADSLAAGGNVARPHAKVGGAVRVVAARDLAHTAAAGGIVSSAVDMTRWLRLQLGRGELEGRRVVSAAGAREMHALQIGIPVGPATERLFPSTHIAGYGLGWFVRDYRGRKLVEHGGNVDGMTAQVALVPEDGLALVVLANMESSPLPTVLMYRVLDAYLGGPAGADLNAELLTRAARAAEQQRARARQADSARSRGTAPSLPLARYAGTYVDSLYGEAVVARERGALVVRLGRSLAGDLTHWERDTFRVEWRDPIVAEALGVALITFGVSAADGAARGVATLSVPSIDAVYTRAGSAPSHEEGR